MKLAKTQTNPILGLLNCFRPYWRHLDQSTYNRFIAEACDHGYGIERSGDVYTMMDILKDMGLIDIQYINGYPDQIIRLYKET